MAAVKERTRTDLQQDRPSGKAMLPFKLGNDIVRGRKVLTVTFDQTVTCADHSTRTLPTRIDEATPLLAAFIKPLHKLMEMYWELEREHDGLAKERDEAVQGAQELKESLRQEVVKREDAERRLARKKGE
jgi:hypothetical protein